MSIFKIIKNLYCTTKTSGLEIFSHSIFFSRLVIVSACNNEIFLLKNNTTKIDKNWQGTEFTKTTKLDSSF